MLYRQVLLKLFKLLKSKRAQTVKSVLEIIVLIIYYSILFLLQGYYTPATKSVSPSNLVVVSEGCECDAVWYICYR